MNSPKEVAAAYCAAGEAKVVQPFWKTFVLAIFAGMFIAFAGVGSTVAPATIQTASVAKLVGALMFPTGLLMVVVAGSELFTGNNLLIIPTLHKRITVGAMLKNWGIVYIGNIIGSILIAFLACYGGVFSLFGEAVADGAVNTAAAKVSMPFISAVCKGILCNVLVCIAVWMSFAAKTVVCKLAAVFLPIMLFVLCGYEHSIANMYYIPAGLFAVSSGLYSSVSPAEGLTWGNFIVKNLIPVTIGNIIGGAGLVGTGYWFVYLN